MTERAIVDRFRAARRDPSLAVLEGFHALKHAIRFGAEIVEAVALDPEEAERLAAELAPDVAGRVVDRVTRVAPATLERITRLPPETGIVALARRPAVPLETILAAPGAAPVVLLDEPASPWNLGAAVRVAAAAGAAGLLSTGTQDPWHPSAVRAAAGLQFAVPVARVDAPPPGDRPLVALDPGGEPLPPARIPARAILAFGSERRGLSAELLEAADLRVRIPMRDGVSSLNLATAVAAVVYAMGWDGG